MTENISIGKAKINIPRDWIIEYQKSKDSHDYLYGFIPIIWKDYAGNAEYLFYKPPKKIDREIFFLETNNSNSQKVSDFIKKLQIEGDNTIFNVVCLEGFYALRHQEKGALTFDIPSLMLYVAMDKREDLDAFELRSNGVANEC